MAECYREQLAGCQLLPSRLAGTSSTQQPGAPAGGRRSTPAAVAPTSRQPLEELARSLMTEEAGAAEDEEEEQPPIDAPSTARSPAAANVAEMEDSGIGGIGPALDELARKLEAGLESHAVILRGLAASQADSAAKITSVASTLLALYERVDECEPAATTTTMTTSRPPTVPSATARPPTTTASTTARPPTSATPPHRRGADDPSLRA